MARLRPLRHPPQPLRRARSPRGSLAPPLASPPPGARIGPSRQKVQHSHARAFGAATGRTAAVIARLTPSMPSACRTMPPKKRKVQGKLSGGRPKKTELYQRLEADVDLEEEAEIRRLEAGPAAAEIDALFAGVCLCLCRLRPCRHLLPAALLPSVSAFSRASDLDSCSAGASSSGGGPVAAAAATAATAADSATAAAAASLAAPPMLPRRSSRSVAALYSSPSSCRTGMNVYGYAFVLS